MVHITRYLVGVAWSLLLTPSIVNAGIAARGLRKLTLIERYKTTFEIDEDRANNIFRSDRIKTAEAAFQESRDILKAGYDAITELQSPADPKLKGNDRQQRQKLEDLFKRFFGVNLNQKDVIGKVQKHYEKMLQQERKDGEKLYIGKKQIRFVKPNEKSQWDLGKNMMRLYPTEKLTQMHEDALLNPIRIEDLRPNLADLAKSKPFQSKILNNRLSDIKAQSTELLRAGIYMYFALEWEKGTSDFNDEDKNHSGQHLGGRLLDILKETEQCARGGPGKTDFTEERASYYFFALAASQLDYDVDKIGAIIKIKNRKTDKESNPWRQW